MGERSHIRSSPPQTPAATHVAADGEQISIRRIRRRGPLFIAGALPVAALLVAGPAGSPQQVAAAHPVVVADDPGTENPADPPDATNAGQDQTGADVIDPGSADSFTAPDFDRLPVAPDDVVPPADDASAA